MSAAVDIYRYAWTAAFDGSFQTANCIPPGHSPMFDISAPATLLDAAQTVLDGRRGCLPLYRQLVAGPKVCRLQV
jgi:hypothetical protein